MLAIVATLAIPCIAHAHWCIASSFRNNYLKSILDLWRINACMGCHAWIPPNFMHQVLKFLNIFFFYRHYFFHKHTYEHGEHFRCGRFNCIAHTVCSSVFGVLYTHTCAHIQKSRSVNIVTLYIYHLHGNFIKWLHKRNVGKTFVKMWVTSCDQVLIWLMFMFILMLAYLLVRAFHSLFYFIE